MAIYWPTPGFKGRTFKLCVLTRWDFNFRVRSSPLRGRKKNHMPDKYINNLYMHNAFIVYTHNYTGAVTRGHGTFRVVNVFMLWYIHWNFKQSILNVQIPVTVSLSIGYLYKQAVCLSMQWFSLYVGVTQNVCVNILTCVSFLSFVGCFG